MRTFHLTIARVGENLFDGEAQSVSLPGTDGVFTVLAGHEAFVSELCAGEAQVKDGAGNLHRIPIPADRGVAEVSAGQATVLL